MKPRDPDLLRESAALAERAITDDLTAFKADVRRREAKLAKQRPTG